jgi:hypothetical protein
MMLETLKQLDEQFCMKKLYEQGIVTQKAARDYEIVILVKMDMDINNSPKTVAVQHTADKLRIAVSRVWEALKEVR